MTFYNIIFGILFIGAFREVLNFSLAEPDWSKFCQASVLSVLIFSDTIYTSMVIEGMEKRYRMKMKLIDLASFVLLSIAVVSLNPNDSDLFEFDATCTFDRICFALGASLEACFWLLLSVYMLLLWIWNYLMSGPRPKGVPSWMHLVQPLLGGWFIFLTALSWEPACPPNMTLPVLRWLTLVAVIVYLVWFKARFCHCLKAPLIELKDLTDHEAVGIRNWPKYKDDLSQLDYALREGGWLDQFPKSDSNKRYGIWHNDVLSGFTMLVTIKDRQAEFYIALHPDKIHKNIGAEATRRTVEKGFSEFNLRRIYLKVRHWYDSAQALYAHCGFRVVGKPHYEPLKVHGEKVDILFVTMERFRRWTDTFR